MGDRRRFGTVRDESPTGGKKARIVVIATGPSLTQKDAKKAQEISEAVIVVNDAWRLLPDANWLYAADRHWWDYHIADVAREFDGECWTQNQAWGNFDPRQYGLKVAVSAGNPGLCKEPGVIHTGGNSGYQAINLALHFGAEQIVLLGFDMSRRDGAHYFGDHPARYPDGKPSRLVNGDPARWLENFRTINPDDYGVEILNATRRTALDAFPLVNLDDLYEAAEF